jgi:regulator of RNase E activity RraA
MEAITARLARIAPSTLGHFVDEGFLDPEIRPVFRPVKLVGRALTVSAPPRDNTIYRLALREARQGDVLVVHRNGDLRHASFGGLLGLAARNRGVAGVILDGPCTDLAELTELGLPVYALGVSALTTRRLDLGGTVGDPVVCGGVHVSTGDYVLADDDGVLIIPAREVETMIERGEAAARREAETREYLLSGKTLDDIDAIRKGGNR